MTTAQTTHTRPAALSRCNDQPSLPISGWNADHKADRAIAERVGRALWKIDVLRRTDYREIDVIVRDGVVFLSGNVITVSNQQRAEAAARTVPDVIDVRNDLVPDDYLTRKVAGALGDIEHIYGVKFFTGARNGVVMLSGEVSSPNVRFLAENCAARIPGVRAVINNVHSPGVDLQTVDQRFMQPIIGEQIYFRDGLLGSVQKVVINPNNRRVVAMIVQKQISNRQSDFASLMSGKIVQPKGLVILPMKLIRYMTRTSGFLHIHSAETAKYADFNPVFFTSPEKGWPLPYPYCRDEVLFRIEAIENDPTGD